MVWPTLSGLLSAGSNSLICVSRPPRDVSMLYRPCCYDIHQKNLSIITSCRAEPVTIPIVTTFSSCAFHSAAVFEWVEATAWYLIQCLHGPIVGWPVGSACVNTALASTWDSEIRVLLYSNSDGGRMCLYRFTDKHLETSAVTVTEPKPKPRFLAWWVTSFFT